MSTIRFIVQGSPDTAADTAYELQQYLQTEWQVQAEATIANKSLYDSADAHSRSMGFDLDLTQIMLVVLSGIKLAIDTAHGFLETKKKLEELSAWAETTFTREYEYLWLEVGGIPYPVKADKLETSSTPYSKHRSNSNENRIKRGITFNLLQPALDRAERQHGTRHSR